MNELSEVIDVYTRDSINTLYRLNIGNELIYTTPEHPFYLNGEWVEAMNLVAGDTLTYYNIELVGILSEIKRVDTLVKVYNFQVEGNHNYYISVMFQMALLKKVKIKSLKKRLLQKRVH